MCPRKEINTEIDYNLMSCLELPVLSTKGTYENNGII